MIWVINASTNSCQIYNYEKSPARLTLIKALQDPTTRLKKGDFFTSDKPGHYRGDTAGKGGAFSQQTDPKEVEIDSFSREIAKELNQGRNNHLYQNLIIIASPHMFGLLQHHLDKHVKELIINNIQKDLQHLNDRELLEYLHAHAQYHDG